MRYSDVVPTELPEGEHPYAGMFVGLVSPGRESMVARLVFDELGARLNTPDVQMVSHAWAVDFALPNGREEVSVGDNVTWQIPGGDTAGVKLVSGALPPGRGCPILCVRGLGLQVVRESVGVSHG